MKTRYLIPILISIIAMSGCAKEEQTAQIGDTVKVHYWGTLETGKEFDSSRGRDPLEFVLGEGKMLPKFEEAVIDMKLQEEKTFTLAPADAYGKWTKDKVIEVPRAQLPDGIKVDDPVMFQAQNGLVIEGVVVEVGTKVHKVDFNHKLAGRTLTFKIRLVDISKP